MASQEEGAKLENRGHSLSSCGEADGQENKNLIRQERELERAVDALRPLLAKIFSIDDRQKQKQKACEIYLWLGLGFAKMGDNDNALQEFRNMFEVDFARTIREEIFLSQASTRKEYFLESIGRFPRAIAFDKEGNFYIVDESDVKIKKFDAEGRFLSSWGEAPFFRTSHSGIEPVMEKADQIIFNFISGVS